MKAENYGIDIGIGIGCNRKQELYSSKIPIIALLLLVVVSISEVFEARNGIVNCNHNFIQSRGGFWDS